MFDPFSPVLKILPSVTTKRPPLKYDASTRLHTQEANQKKSKSKMHLHIRALAQ